MPNPQRITPSVVRFALAPALYQALNTPWAPPGLPPLPTALAAHLDLLRSLGEADGQRDT